MSLSVRPGDDGAAPAIPVATLCSDPTGYLSFDLQELISAGLDMASGVLVSAPQAVIHQIPASKVPEQALNDLDPSLSGPGGEGMGTLL